MANVKYICCPKKPFVLFSMGLSGYEGECSLWKLPKTEINVYHILVRIKHEIGLAGGQQSIYPFGTYKPFQSAKNKVIENYGKGPIDMFFTVNLSDLAKLDDVSVPSTTDLRQSSRGWRTMVNVDNGKRMSIPKEIHLWGGNLDRPYYGLALASFQYFMPTDEFYLRGENLLHYLQESPVRSWCQFTLGTLLYNPQRKTGSVQDRRILATGKLKYPYVYEIRP